MILQGDAITVLKSMKDQSVNCCVTSPPYWGLRDYGTAKWEGGDPSCDHALPMDAPNSSKMTAGQQSSHAGRFAHLPCLKCGAIRVDSQLGLEPTPEEYVSHLVEVFHEVKRVLRDDGTLWLNLGDSYASVHTGGHKSEKSTVGSNKEGIQEIKQSKSNPAQYGLKSKDLVGIPWMVAFALRADGWYLRQDIIWSKTNPMPESVTDRCTKSHEYIFLLSKGKKYYYDFEAVKEPANPKYMSRYKSEFNNGNKEISGQGRPKAASNTAGIKEYTGYRNKRDVWVVSTRSFKDAHFATFPPELIRPCVLAGCPVGGIVLDPFFGAGTTGLVAIQEQRDYVGIELNPAYIEIAEKRLNGVQIKMERLLP